MAYPSMSSRISRVHICGLTTWKAIKIAHSTVSMLPMIIMMLLLSTWTRRHCAAALKSVWTLYTLANKLEKQIAELEAQEAQLNIDMAALDPDDRMATVDMAYQFEKVQTALQDALNDWETATNELESLQNRR